MKKFLIVIAMIFGGVICAFGLEETEDALTENMPIVTGGWQEIDDTDLDESVKTFAIEYLEGRIPNNYSFYKGAGWVVDSVWTQLVQGRRYQIDYHVLLTELKGDENTFHDLPSILCQIGLILRKNPDGTIFLEEEYRWLSLLTFIETMFSRRIDENRRFETPNFKLF
jgi:hypothetical protein